MGAVSEIEKRAGYLDVKREAGGGLEVDGVAGSPRTLPRCYTPGMTREYVDHDAFAASG